MAWPKEREELIAEMATLVYLLSAFYPLLSEESSSLTSFWADVIIEWGVLYSTFACYHSTGLSPPTVQCTAAISSLCRIITEAILI
jgi:hypothetical protein